MAFVGWINQSYISLRNLWFNGIVEIWLRLAEMYQNDAFVLINA